MQTTSLFRRAAALALTACTAAPEVSSPAEAAPPAETAAIGEAAAAECGRDISGFADWRAYIRTCTKSEWKADSHAETNAV